MSKKNAMGSVVLAGTACKPEKIDPDKPIMFAATQLFVCDDERCHSCHTGDLAEKLRALIKEQGCHCGIDRIKVTRTGCQGACRYRAFASVYRNGNARNYSPATSFSAWKRVHEWSDEQWREMLVSLREGRLPDTLSEFRVADKVYDDE